MSDSNSQLDARNARVEAQTIVGDTYAARVIEPSPPAVSAGPFFADDPVSTDGAGGKTILPTGMGGDFSWDDWLANNADQATAEVTSWVKEHWLGGNRQLPPVPPSLVATRIALHRLAAYVIAPTRHADNGKFGLRSTHGGFGTSFFGEDRQVRVEGVTLIDQRGDEVRSTPITSLNAAATFLATQISSDAGAEPDSPPIGDPDADLAVDETASAFLGSWFAMGFAALEALRAHPDSVDAARPQLWPGHFDPAIEVGDEDHRGSYGASPGDPSIAEPYLYVSIWWPDRIGINADDPYWNAPSFTGAVMRLSDFPPGVDPVIAARDFWIETRDRLG